MKMFRWLLCHLLSITLLVSFIMVFSFRDVLKEDFNRLLGKSSQSAETKNVSDNDAKDAKDAVAADTAQNNPAGRPQVSTEPPAAQPFSANVENRYTRKYQSDRPVDRNASLQNENSSDPWDNVLTGSVNESKETTSSVGDENKQAVSGSNFPPEDYDPEENGQETATIENTRGRNADSPNTFESNDESLSLSKPLSNKVDVPAAGDSSSEAAKYFQILEETRQLYWDGKSGPAQAAYEKLMFEYPEQPEAPAELGNMFLQQGNRKAASWAYQNAIPRYLNLHREQEAINLIRFVSQYDPAIAESLQKKYW